MWLRPGIRSEFKSVDLTSELGQMGSVDSVSSVVTGCNESTYLIRLYEGDKSVPSKSQLLFLWSSVTILICAGMQT